MRISVCNTDPGFRADAMGGKYSALLNGVKVEHCITADEEEGMVLAFVYEDGKPRIEGGQVVTEERRGTVQILRDGKPIT